MSSVSQRQKEEQMTAADQELRKRRMRDAELMPLIVRLQNGDDLDIARGCIDWDDDDIAFAQNTRLGRIIVERFNSISPEQIGQWSEEGVLFD